MNILRVYTLGLYGLKDLGPTPGVQVLRDQALRGTTKRLVPAEDPYWLSDVAHEP